MPQAIRRTQRISIDLSCEAQHFIPGWLHPVYIVKEALPEGCWTYPPDVLGGVPVLVGALEDEVGLGLLVGAELEAAPGRH